MKIVLIDEVENLGIAGDIREVKDGYGRNYLIPKNLAVLATKDELARAESRRKVEVERRSRLNSEVEGVVGELREDAIVMEVRVGPAGRLYGSVTATDIAEAVGERVGKELDRHAVELPQPIREVGDREVRVRLAPDVFANLTVSVQPEGGLPPTADVAAETDEEPTIEQAIAAEEQRLAEETGEQPEDAAATDESQDASMETSAVNDAASAAETTSTDTDGPPDDEPDEEKNED